jgi:hypothetical protein
MLLSIADSELHAPSRHPRSFCFRQSNQHLHSEFRGQFACLAAQFLRLVKEAQIRADVNGDLAGIHPHQQFRESA